MLSQIGNFTIFVHQHPDLITQGQIWEFVLKELKRREMGMIAVSHSPELLEKVCDRVVRYPQADLRG